MTTLETARSYAQSGLSVVPVRADGSKASAVPWKPFQSRIATDGELAGFFSNGSGIAIIAGAVSGNLEIIDIEEAETFLEWIALVAVHDAALAKSLVVVMTPSGGYHAYYRCPVVEGNLKLAMYPGEGGRPETLIETRGIGGYCLAPGSPAKCHVANKPYELHKGSLGDIPTITEQQRSLLLDCARSFNRVRREVKTPAVQSAGSNNGSRPGDVFAANVGWPEILEPHGWVCAGSHGDETFWRRPGKATGLSASSNYHGSDLFYCFSSNSHPFEHETSYTKFYAHALLNHGGDLTAATRELAHRFGMPSGKKTDPRVNIPKGVVEGDARSDSDQQRDAQPGEHFPLVQICVKGSPDAHEDSADRPTRYSDDAIADQFSARYEHDLRYVPSWGWLEYTGQRWRKVPDVVVMDRARGVCRTLAQLCKEDPDQKTRDGLARTIASAKTVAAVERLARGDRRHYSEVSEWDADLWSFNTPGGTIDLKAGQLRPHRREDKVTKLAGATPGGVCEQWLVFLDRITGGDASRQAYLKRLMGYALVGDPSEECFDFFHGNGGNGKGTLLLTIQHVFGEYATTAGTETFIESGTDKHPCDIAKLAGARLVIANEVDEGQRWDEARIKNLTGRDVMTARFMRQDFFEFVPQFTLIIAGNHKPSLKTVDDSIRRRVHLVPFNVTIPAEERNTNLKAELRAEADGILAWAVEGCLEWQREGLNPPESVLAATAEYLQSEDVFEQWLGECCLRDPEFSDASRYLYESYRHWRTARGEKVSGHKAFSSRLEARGFSLRRTKSSRRVSGLKLTDQEYGLVERLMEVQRKAEGDG